MNRMGGVKLLVSLGLCVALVTWVEHEAWAQTQGDEPTAPKSDEPTAPQQADEPAPSKADEPTSPQQADEPGGGSSDEPTGGKPAEEPKAPPKPEAEVKKKKEGASSYGIGFHARAIFVHPWLLGLFLDESTSLNSGALGGEFVRHKDNLDLVASIDFAFYSPTDGNYLGKNKNPATKTDYVQFRDLNVLSFSAHVIWHEELTSWLSFVYGVGAGLGIVLGDVYRISNDPGRCTKENAGDENACFPVGVDPTRREETISATAGGTDTPEDPHLFKEDDIPPVIPMIQLLVGFNFKISEQFAIRVDGGFRNAFYIGATGHWFL